MFSNDNRLVQYKNNEYDDDYTDYNLGNDFDINKLHQIQDHRENKRNSFYQTILQKCYSRIDWVSRYHSFSTSCCYEIPEFVPGIPPHDMDLCIKYIYNSLLSNGFKVKYVSKNILYISWKKNELRNFKTQQKNKEINKKSNSEKRMNMNSIKGLYRETSDYKPSGNFIYGNIWNKIKNRNKSFEM